jgi:hypothetical protein
MDDVLPAGAIVADQPIGIRDDYTTLAWLAGSVAIDRMSRPASAVAMYDRYARAGRSLQVQTKGSYWAGRAALAAGRFQEANTYFQRAAAYPELFYGQLALERLGRSVTPPSAALPQYVTSQLQRTAFNSRRLVQAIRLLGRQGRSTEQALFVKALAETLDNDTDRNLAVDLGQQIGRQDLAVWTARMARVKGSMFYVRQAYPTLPATVSGELWSLAHGISRQESSFDPYAVSHAGARDDAADDWNGARAGRQAGCRVRQLSADQRSQLQRDDWLGVFSANVEHLGRQRAARRCELQRRFGQRRQVGETIWRPTRPGRRPQVDRGDPLRRDEGVCAKGNREQRCL